MSVTINTTNKHSVIQYDADLLTYIDGLSTPLSADILGKINTFLTNYKSDDGLTNLSDAYDVMYYLGNETAESSLRNMVKRAHDAVAVNAPTFTAYEGWAGDGISSYINTNYNPATQAVNYALNNASLGVYSRTNSNDLYYEIGSTTSGDDFTGIVCRYNSKVQMRLHNSTYPFIFDSNENNQSLGMFVAARNAQSEDGLFGYQNKKLKATVGSGNTYNIPNCNIFICARSNGIVAGYFSPRQLSFAFAGNHRTQTSVNYLTDRFEALMDSNSKGVIS